MKVLLTQNIDDKTSFKAKLNIEYIDNIGRKTPDIFHPWFEDRIIRKGRGNDPIKALNIFEIFKLKNIAAKIGNASDTIAIKINKNTDADEVERIREMGGDIIVTKERQGIKVITDINNNLGSHDLSRVDDVTFKSFEDRIIPITSPFQVIEKYLKNLLGK